MLSKKELLRLNEKELLRRANEYMNENHGSGVGPGIALVLDMVQLAFELHEEQHHSAGDEDAND